VFLRLNIGSQGEFQRGTPKRWVSTFLCQTVVHLNIARLPWRALHL